MLIIHSYHSSCNIQYFARKINIDFFNLLVSVHILKIDLQTLDMKSQSREHPFNSSVQENYMVLEENVKNTESEAVIKYDFNKPKQYIIYNENERNPRNNQSRGMIERLMCLSYCHRYRIIMIYLMLPHVVETMYVCVCCDEMAIVLTHYNYITS